MSKHRADVLLVTTTQIESKTIIRTFENNMNQKVLPFRIDNRVYFDLGKVNEAKVILLQTEMGGSGIGAAIQTVQIGIDSLLPSAVIMVGIAFGMDERKQEIGDILVAQQVHCYENQRVNNSNEKSGYAFRGDKPHVSTRLLNNMKSAELLWEGSKVHYGVILSGEKLVDDPNFKDFLKSIEPEAIGGEMEGAGLYVACQEKKVDWILVKSICDWADGNKAQDKELRQQTAARNASEFVLHSLQFVPYVYDEEKKQEVLTDIVGASFCQIDKKITPEVSLNSLGIVAVYKNLDECAQDMQDEFEKAKYIRLLLQIGRRELGDGKSSLFWSRAKSKIQYDSKIEVLRASEESPFLSKERNKKRGRTSYDRWMKHLNDLHEEIVYLRDNCHVQIYEEKHCEPFLWRIFLMDDIAFVSGYIYSQENDSNAVVYKFCRGDNSLYSIFDKYFKYLWLYYSPDEKRGAIDKWVDFK